MPSKELDRDAFLRLLVTQLSNQDPLNPQDGHEFAAQLAQFSSVEQLTNISETLALHSEQIAMLTEGMAVASSQQVELAGMMNDRATLSTATALIGKTVEAAGDGLGWDGEGPAAFGFRLERPAAQVTITIRDEHGNAVRTLDGG
ncbi:MAG: flagellar hook capping FlgD N-terminal domain-containing protein, partial [Rhodothermales bacterium]|nr:flagellar hook capping FlgD N-terminal domain-containing protein [Rhodothermales bacterium]